MLMLYYLTRRSVKTMIVTVRMSREPPDEHGSTIIRTFMNSMSIEDLKVGLEYYYRKFNWNFSAEMSPEDIFEMFFGGAFPSSSMNRRRAQYHYRQEYHQQQREEPVNLYEWLYTFCLFSLLPIATNIANSHHPPRWPSCSIFLQRTGIFSESRQVNLNTTSLYKNSFNV